MPMIEKINIVDLTVIIGLVVALMLAIFYDQKELAMSIASGLLGYIGGNIKTATTNRRNDSNESIH